jgi:energy-converting hydrogenase A subunit R
MNRKPIFVTDCEGPLTKNDNAAELAAEFIPEGHRFFSTISLYDDYLAEVVRKPGYKAGDTLRLILPFYKTFGLTNRAMIEFSRNNIEMIPLADRVLKEITELIPSYVVSTSYSPYIQAVCKAMDFDFGHTFSTAVDLDRFELTRQEAKELHRIHTAILELPLFSLTSGACSVDDLSPEDKDTVEKLDRIFWTELPRMEIYRMVEEVNPVGGREKAVAVERIAQTEGAALSDILYVGDSITDVQAFRLVKSGQGLALSFNGNDWAVRDASFAVTARNALPIGWFATMFAREGVTAFEDLTVGQVTEENSTSISKLSSMVRKQVRTERIGSLG